MVFLVAAAFIEKTAQTAIFGAMFGAAGRAGARGAAAAGAFPGAKEQDPGLPASNIWFEVGGRPDFRPPAARLTRKRPLPHVALRIGAKSGLEEEALAVATFSQALREESRARKRARTADLQGDEDAHDGADAQDRAPRRDKEPAYSWETWYDYSKLDAFVKRAVSAQINLAELENRDVRAAQARATATSSLKKSAAGKSQSPAKALLESLRCERLDALQFEDRLLDCLRGDDGDLGAADAEAPTAAPES